MNAEVTDRIRESQLEQRQIEDYIANRLLFSG